MSIFNIFRKLFYTRKFVSSETCVLIKRDWQNISSMLKGGSPSQMRQALISADKTMDAALKDLVSGSGMGERLKYAKNLFSPDTYDKIWKAHKVRNNLVHEAGYEPTYFVLKSSIEDLKRGLIELKVNL